MEWSGVVRQNQERLDAAAMGRLGHYVYVLQDPDNDRVFYVGKGGGKNGNDRVLHHFDEADAWLAGDHAGEAIPEKIRTILSVWKRGRSVRWFIVQHNLANEDEALRIEAALLDALALSRNGPLDNLQGGHGAREHGLLSASGVAAFNVPPANPTRPYRRVLVFPIQRALRSGVNAYDAVRRAWSAGDALRRNVPGCLAVGVDQGISRIVVDIAQWHESPGAPDKYEFTGAVLEEHELLHRNFSNVQAPAMGYWMHGNFIGAEFDGQGHFRILHGAADKTTAYDCA